MSKIPFDSTRASSSQFCTRIHNHKSQITPNRCIRTHTPIASHTLAARDGRTRILLWMKAFGSNGMRPIACSIPSEYQSEENNRLSASLFIYIFTSAHFVLVCSSMLLNTSKFTKHCVRACVCVMCQWLCGGKSNEL